MQAVLAMGFDSGGSYSATQREQVGLPTGSSQDRMVFQQPRRERLRPKIHRYLCGE